MKLFEIILIEDVTDRLLSDKRLCKMIAIHFRHDHTIPAKIKFSIGPKVSDEKVMDIWLKFLDKINNSEDYGVISPDKKYYEWLTRLYASGADDWEDIAANASQTLANFLFLCRRGHLTQEQMDLNRYTRFEQLTHLTNKFSNELRKYKDEALLNAAITGAKEITIVDTPEYVVLVPVNKGAAIKYARSVGAFATWCTGAFSSANMYDTYARNSPLIIFMDKEHPDKKIQMHANSGQFMNIQNGYASKETFAQEYPRAMAQIVQGLKDHATELAAAGGWDMDNQINLVQRTFLDAFGRADDGSYLQAHEGDDEVDDPDDQEDPEIELQRHQDEVEAEHQRMAQDPNHELHNNDDDDGEDEEVAARQERLRANARRRHGIPEVGPRPPNDWDLADYDLWDPVGGADRIGGDTERRRRVAARRARLGN